MPPGSRLVAPRAFTTLSFAITNNGITKDAFTLSIKLPEGWSTISSLNPVTLKPGQLKKKLITVSVPPAALSNLNYPVQLTVASRTDATVKSTVTTELRVKDVLGLRLTPEPYPELVWAGEIVNYGFEIKNLGNSDDIFEIKTSSSRNWKTEISKNIKLGPYQKKVVHLLLKVPRDVKQDQLHVLSFQVSSVNAAKQGRDISDKTKIRLKTIAPADKTGTTYRELPGSMELEFSEINDKIKGMPEVSMRLEIAGDLNEEYFSRLYVDNTFWGDEAENYFFELNKKEKWDLSLGHTYADFTRLTEDLSGEGISTRTYGKQFETVFWAGRSDTETGSENAVEDDEDDDYSVGAGITALIGEKGRLCATSIFTDQKDSDWTKRLYSLSGEYKIFKPVILSGEVAYGSENTETQQKKDSAWFVKSDFNWERSGISADYYHGGTDYPGGITDEEGIGVYSYYQLFEPLTIWFDYQRYNDNVDDNPANITTRTEKIKAGPQFRYGNWPTIDVTLEREKKKNNDLNILTGNDRVEDSVALGLYKAFPFISLSTMGKWGMDRNLLKKTSARTSGYNATAGGYYKMLNWRISYDRDDSRQEDTDSREIKEKMEYSLGCRLFNFLDVNGEYSNEIIRSDNDKTREETFDIDLTVRKKIGIGKKQSLDLKFEWDNVTEDVDSEWKIGLVWRMNFGMPVPWIKTKGRVSGQLFLDEDGSGKRGADEIIYPKTRISLNQMHVYTDKNGIFEFPVQDPGNYHLDMDMSRLSSGIIPATTFPRDIALEKGDNIFIDIPLEQVGTIQGVVFDDGNKNFLQDKKNEDGLSPIRLVLLQDEKEIQEAFTDQKGKYILADVKPGDYILKIDKDYLPRRYIMTTPETIRVSIISKEQVSGLNFGAYKKPRKIIKTFFKKKK